MTRANLHRKNCDIFTLFTMFLALLFHYYASGVTYWVSDNLFHWYHACYKNEVAWVSFPRYYRQKYARIRIAGRPAQPEATLYQFIRRNIKFHIRKRCTGIDTLAAYCEIVLFSWLCASTFETNTLYDAHESIRASVRNSLLIYHLFYIYFIFNINILYVITFYYIFYK